MRIESNPPFIFYIVALPLYGSKYVFLVSNKLCFRECLICLEEDITTIKHQK